MCVAVGVPGVSSFVLIVCLCSVCVCLCILCLCTCVRVFLDVCVVLLRFVVCMFRCSLRSFAHK